MCADYIRYSTNFVMLIQFLMTLFLTVNLEKLKKDREEYEEENIHYFIFQKSPPFIFL